MKNNDTDLSPVEKMESSEAQVRLRLAAFLTFTLADLHGSNVAAPPTVTRDR